MPQKLNAIYCDEECDYVTILKMADFLAIIHLTGRPALAEAKSICTLLHWDCIGRGVMDNHFIWVLCCFMLFYAVTS